MAHPISEFIVKYFNWVFLGFLALNLIQRRYREKAQKKRFATLYIAILVFLLFTFANSLVTFKLPEWLLLVFFAAAAVVGWLLREHMFPFRFRCKSCSKTLTFDQIMFNDANLCADCLPKDEQPVQAEPSAETDQEEEEEEEEEE
jgi:hypothetical protein